MVNAAPELKRQEAETSETERTIHNIVTIKYETYTLLGLRNVYVPVTDRKPRGCRRGIVTRGHRILSSPRRRGERRMFRFVGKCGLTPNEEDPEVLKA